MRLKEGSCQGIDVFALEGDVDLHYAPSLRAVLRPKIKARCPSLIVDLTRVSFIDSTGMSVIIEYFRDAGEFGGVLCLCGLNEELKNIFRIVGLDRSISMFDNVEAAASAICKGEVTRPNSELAAK
jgi:anti-sigma B factor antagonist